MNQQKRKLTTLWHWTHSWRISQEMLQFFSCIMKKSVFLKKFYDHARRQRETLVKTRKRANFCHIHRVMILFLKWFHFRVVGNFWLPFLRQYFVIQNIIIITRNPSPSATTCEAYRREPRFARRQPPRRSLRSPTPPPPLATLAPPTPKNGLSGQNRLSGQNGLSGQMG